MAARRERSDSATRRAVIAATAGLAGSIVLVFLYAGYLTRAIIGPVRRASLMADELARGDLATRMPATGVAEIGRLERAFNEMAGSLERNRDELADLASEQAALRRVATLVARRAAPEEVFTAVAEEMAQRLGAEITKVLRYEPDGTATIVGGWSIPSMHVPIGTRLTVEGVGVAVNVLETGRPARTEKQEGPPGSVADCFRKVGVKVTIGSPIVVEGALWGVAVAGSSDLDALPPRSEERIGEFTELVATAIANAQSRSELAASRARVVAAADETRRRVERDLHDGAQQRLVTLALRLRAAAAGVPPVSEVRAELDRVGAELDEVFADLRELSRGIHPALLSEGGLGPALRTLARRSAVPVELEVRTDERLPEQVEIAAYYVVSEALTNVAKHADASTVRVDVAADNGVVRLAIRDDGVGGADPARGSGLIGLKDRVEARGGTMTVESRPGEGTSLVVELPVDAESGADPS
jgi:signal transduction histidine kinase